MTTELVYLGVAAVVIALILFLLRRAAAKSQAGAPKTVQERLGVTADEPTRRARRPRPGRPVPEGAEAREPTEAGLEDRPAPAPVDAEVRDAYQQGLAKTRGGFVARMGKLFGKKQIDADVLGELEEVLFTADIGPRAADRIFQAVKSNLTKDELSDPKKIWTQIRRTSATILDVGAPPVDFSAHKPFVLLTIGVNGVGKTTTIGKLASLLVAQERKVLLAAGDTFRAA